MNYTIGILLLALIAAAFLFLGGSSKKEKAAKAPVSRYQKVSTAVFNEPDGSIAQVNSWIRQNIGDSGVTVQHWGQVTKVGRGYEANIVIRTRNAQSARVASKYKFEFNTMGEVISAYDVEAQAQESREAAQALKDELNALDQQIALVRRSLAEEERAWSVAKGNSRINSRGSKVENITKTLEGLLRQREQLQSEVYRKR